MTARERAELVKKQKESTPVDVEQFAEKTTAQKLGENIFAIPTGFAQGLTGGKSDEAVGAIGEAANALLKRSLIGSIPALKDKEAYLPTIEEARMNQNYLKQNAPIAYKTAEGVGGLIGGLMMPASKGVGAVRVLKDVGKGILSGASTGAGYSDIGTKPTSETLGEIGTTAAISGGVPIVGNIVRAPIANSKQLRQKLLGLKVKDRGMRDITAEQKFIEENAVRLFDKYKTKPTLEGRDIVVSALDDELDAVMPKYANEKIDAKGIKNELTARLNDFPTYDPKRIPQHAKAQEIINGLQKRLEKNNNVAEMTGIIRELDRKLQPLYKTKNLDTIANDTFNVLFEYRKLLSEKAKSISPEYERIMTDLSTMHDITGEFIKRANENVKLPVLGKLGFDIPVKKENAQAATSQFLKNVQFLNTPMLENVGRGAQGFARPLIAGEVTRDAVEPKDLNTAEKRKAYRFQKLASLTNKEPQVMDKIPVLQEVQQ